MSCRKANGPEQAGSKKQKPYSKTGEDEQADLQFGRMEVGQSRANASQRPKKKKPSKEQLLQDAVQKQQQKADGVGDAKVLYTSSISKSVVQPCLSLCWHGCSFLESEKHALPFFQLPESLKGRPAGVWQCSVDVCKQLCLLIVGGDKLADFVGGVKLADFALLVVCVYHELLTCSENLVIS